MTEAVLSDGTGTLRLSWFNRPWMTNSFRKDDQVVVSGKLDMYLGRLVMNTPEIEELEKEHLHTSPNRSGLPLNRHRHPKIAASDHLPDGLVLGPAPAGLSSGLSALRGRNCSTSDCAWSSRLISPIPRTCSTWPAGGWRLMKFSCCNWACCARNGPGSQPKRASLRPAQNGWKIASAGLPYTSPVPNGARSMRYLRGPGHRPAHGPPAARRCRVQEKRLSQPWQSRWSPQRRAGRRHGPHQHPGRTAFPQLHPACWHSPPVKTSLSLQPKQIRLLVGDTSDAEKRRNPRRPGEWLDQTGHRHACPDRRPDRFPGFAAGGHR